MPARVFLGLGGETPGSVGTGGSPARSGLLGHVDGTGTAGLFGHGHGAGATVLALPRSTLATAGALDHAGGAVGHRAGTSRYDRGAGALTAGDDRWDDRGATHRAAVAGSDAARAGNVRGAGEATGFGLVGVGALIRVAAAALLAPGQALGPAANDVVAAGVASGLHEPVRPGVRAGLHEAVRAGVAAGLDESV
ncbi:hypothetical protein ACFO0C_08235 [Actinoplanes subglobosus]|uniref:Uncharacterized protein n=1 Tax=Actinoplanes subglobosus TaxID=1547892 RepID=A0ABV8IP03_9ACTN